MADQFKLHEPGLESPATRIAAVTPDDGADLPFVARALHVTGTGGPISVVTVDGDEGDVFVPQGGYASIRVRRVRATGTDATGIRALA